MSSMQLIHFMNLCEQRKKCMYKWNWSTISNTINKTAYKTEKLSPEKDDANNPTPKTAF